MDRRVWAEVPGWLRRHAELIALLVAAAVVTACALWSPDRRPPPGPQGPAAPSTSGPASASVPTPTGGLGRLLPAAVDFDNALEDNALEDNALEVASGYVRSACGYSTEIRAAPESRRAAAYLASAAIGRQRPTATGG